MIDPGDGIPDNPDDQLPLLTRTNNGWHDLDPPEDEQPNQDAQHSLFGIENPSRLSLSTASIQQQLLFMAQSHLGYVEDSKRRSEFGIWYGNQPSVNNSAFDTAPWCDMFLAKLTSDLLGVAGLKAIGDYALTTAHASFLHGKGVTSRPGTFPTGAFAFQNWDLNGVGNGNLNKIDHVEMVEQDHQDGTATYVGGNIANGVRRRRRAKGYCVVIAEWWKLLPNAPVSTGSNVWFQS